MLGPRIQFTPDQINMKEENSFQRVKSKIHIYRISSVSSPGFNPVNKNEDPTAKKLNKACAPNRKKS